MVLKTTSSSKSTPVESKKRKLRKSKESDDESLNTSKTSLTMNENEQEEEYTNRKSLRIKNQTSVATTSTAKISPLGSSNLVAGETNNKLNKLNGAQFVAAAAAGNFNVSASIGSTSITIDSNSNLDLNQLNQSVERLNKTISQHSILLKQLNNSIEKLSTKLNTKIGASSLGMCRKKKLNTNRFIPKKTKQQEKLTTTEQEESKCVESGFVFENAEEPEEINDQNVNDDDDDEEEEEEKELIRKQDLVQVEPRPAETFQNLDIIENNTQTQNQESSFNLIETNAPLGQIQTTVKLTNDMNEISSNKGELCFLSSDSSSKSDDEEKDDENDADEDEGDDDYGENESPRSNNANTNKNNKRKKKTSISSSSNTSQKSPNATKAILNKTKIDTEFITKLLASKYPNDKRYDPVEINKLRLLSHSYQNFAVKLLMRLFDEEEIIGRNVYGRNYSGDKTIMKQPLDPERINFIKETVIKLTKTNNPDLAWASCVIAMNRKMVDINNKFIKNIKLDNK